MSKQKQNADIRQSGQKIMKLLSNIHLSTVWVTSSHVTKLTQTTFDKIITELEALERAIK